MVVKFSRITRKNKYYIVGRYADGKYKGQLVTTRKWSQKFNLTSARGKFKRDGTLRKGVKILDPRYNTNIFVNVREVTDYTQTQINPSAIKSGKITMVSGIARAVINGNEVVGRSSQVPTTHLDSNARLNLQQIAKENLLKLLSESLANTNYGDTVKAQKYIDQNKIRINTGLIYYQKL